MFDQLTHFVTTQLGKNDLIAGGAVLGVLAYLLSYLRSVPLIAARGLKLLFVTEIDIPDRSDTFQWISDWLSYHPYTRRAKRITIEGGKNKPSQNDEPNNTSLITPAPGRHLVWWKRWPLLISRVRREGTGDNAHRAFRESWEISLVGRRKLVEDFIEQCRKVSQTEQEKYVRVCEADSMGYWESGNKRRKRPLETVILPKGLKDELMQDLHEFIEAKKWYEEKNIPWRRGYLLTGEPGNGKSSIITAVASEIDFKICIANLKNLDEDSLVSLMSTISEKSILLLEDIDCAFEERDGKTAISLSTMLNLLDGVNATEGRIVFMTTNHPEKLDSALIRDGRVDLTIELPNATQFQAAELYKRFFPDANDSIDFGLEAASYKPSMAKLQGYLLRNRASSEKARANIKELEHAQLSNLAR